MKKFALPILIIFLAAGCQTPVGVSHIGREEAYRQESATAVNSGRASRFTNEVLADHGMADRFLEEPDKALAELHAILRQDPRRDLAFALAELSFLEGGRARAKDRYLASLVYAYAFLFDDRFAGTREPYDPRFRIACDLYNSALTEFLRADDESLVLEGGLRELPFGRMRIEVIRSGFPWGTKLFDRFVSAKDFDPRGLRDHYRNPGLGAPLVAIRAPLAEGSENLQHIPRALKVPATAFLRVASPPGGALDGEFAGTIELYATFNVLRIDVGGSPVPLEADLTVPIAYSLQESKVWGFELGGFLHSKSSEYEPGIYMLQPHTPGKIPVVFVHGTMSSPARWAEMYNSLQGYDEIRNRFEFWLFLYPTGNPIPYSAKRLRDSLLAMVGEFDPEGKDPALRQMVIIGHSQGGLLTKMVATDSGRRFFEEFEKEGDLKELDLTPKQMAELESYVVFQRVPAVRRAVFICAPHRGSFITTRWYSKLGAALISPLEGMVSVGKKVLGHEETLAEKLGKRIPTSVENMTPGSRFLRALERIPISPEVTAHSIIAVKGSGPPEGGNDGVVEFKSAHLDGVASEFVVRHDHSCQSDPLVILEVRRILLEHLRSRDKAP
jgi:pimeloyl-ACP methyl ester carboxylesterase